SFIKSLFFVSDSGKRLKVITLQLQEGLAQTDNLNL
ncbi:MAG: hypothetical protein FD151_2246, partial [bacterium]